MRYYYCLICLQKGYSPSFFRVNADAYIQQVQDEMIALNLQLSMAEKERDRVKQENKELIDRWMKRMAQEADAMNLANEH